MNFIYIFDLVFRYHYFFLNQTIHLGGVVFQKSLRKFNFSPIKNWSLLNVSLYLFFLQKSKVFFYKIQRK